MPLKTPFSASNKSDTQPKGKAVPPPEKGKRGPAASAKGKVGGKPSAPAPKKGKPAPPPPKPAPPSWWETLSPERKLDVVGAVMAVVGLLTILILFSAQRSALTGSMLRVFSQIFGWGIYILPVGLILMGLWLILRRIEKLPPLHLERATGIILLFFWLLAVMHAFIAVPELADQAALDGAGGGYFGSFFEKILFNSLGAGGAWVALIAWLVITVTMIFDISVQDLFRWVNPTAVKIRALLMKPKIQTGEPLLPAANNGFTTLNRPEPVIPPGTPVAPVTTVKAQETV